ncbi:MAG: DUF4935 domain-containing protein [Rhodothermia bacterium]|nr:DUF4935 domain-containing protein [Rhodothermia bacterium]
MHVFIDTNILLNFYHFSKDELDTLNDVFASYEHGSAIVHLTEQVRNEFQRNRENKIKDALRKFHDVKITQQLPTFMRSYVEFDQIRSLARELEKKRNSIQNQADRDISEHKLLADILIGDIIERSEVTEITDEVFAQVQRRVALGNPPGKQGSLGDAVNWMLLLESVPSSEDMHLISEDGDFYSVLHEEEPHPFLAREWKEKKGASLFVYRTLTSFIEEHFDGVAFSFDKDKDALIDGLIDCGSFANTHALIAQLEEYSYFSFKEVNKILAAAADNNQFGWIVTDDDVAAFLNRVAVPHLPNITDSGHRKILTSVLDYLQGRDDDDA